MRIITSGDWHLGSGEQYGHTNPKTGLSSRMEDLLASIDELVDYAISNDADIVVITGDIYRSREPTPTQQREFASRIVRLTAAGIPVTICPGNHDQAYAVSRASAVEVFSTLAIPGVTILNEVKSYTVMTKSAGPLQLVSIPWVNRSWSMAQDSRANHVASLQEHVRDAVVAAVAELDVSVPSIQVGHLSGSWAVPGSEAGMSLGNDPSFGVDVLAPEGAPFLYSALGHLHSYQVNKSAGFPLVYAGSLFCLDFGERGQQKGFVDIDIDEKKIKLNSFTFIPVQTRAFIEIEVDAQSSDPTSEVLAAIGRRRADVAGAVVKVRVQLTVANQQKLDDTTIQRALKDAGVHFFAGCARDVEEQTRVRLAGVENIGSLTEMEALAHYFDSLPTMTPARRAVLLEHAERLVKADHDAD